MIEILPRHKAYEKLKENPYQTYAIIIGEPDVENELIDEMLDFAKDPLYLSFFDTEFPRISMPYCKEEDVRKAIRWAEDKEDFIVSCQMGRSRSSALALILNYIKDPDNATDILSRKLHMPNQLIIKHGCKILGKHFEEIFQRWAS